MKKINILYTLLLLLAGSVMFYSCTRQETAVVPSSSVSNLPKVQLTALESDARNILSKSIKVNGKRVNGKLVDFVTAHKRGKFTAMQTEDKGIFTTIFRCPDYKDSVFVIVDNRESGDVLLQRFGQEIDLGTTKFASESLMSSADPSFSTPTGKEMGDVAFFYLASQIVSSQAGLPYTGNPDQPVAEKFFECRRQGSAEANLNCALAKAYRYCGGEGNTNVHDVNYTGDRAGVNADCNS